MRLPELLQKIKEIPDLPQGVFAILFIVLLVSGGFMANRLLITEKSRKDSLRVLSGVGTVLGSGEATPASQSALSGGGEGKNPGMYVASNTGKVFYAPWCGGAKRIHDENKIWFSSKDDAIARGYRPAHNCKGI